MATLRFALPHNLTEEARRSLAQLEFLAGPERYPVPANVEIVGSQLLITAEEGQSGRVAVPWEIPGFGRVLLTTATLTASDKPYDLLIELARGLVNQVRNQAIEWEQNGSLRLSASLQRSLADLSRSFGKSLFVETADPIVKEGHAANVIKLGATTGNAVVGEYVSTVGSALRQVGIDIFSRLGVHVNDVSAVANLGSRLTGTFSRVSVPVDIARVCPAPGAYRWESADETVELAERLQLPLVGGPLVDFRCGLPAWLLALGDNRRRFAAELISCLTRIIDRYQQRISAWRLVASANLPRCVAFDDNEMIWLAIQMVEAARRAAPKTHAFVGITDPYGDYRAIGMRTYSPHAFADTLLRCGIGHVGLDIEVLMGVAGLGSYCRDRLSFAQMLESYAEFGRPMQIHLGYPAATSEVEDADRGYWQTGLDPSSQSDWAAAFVPVALLSHCVEGVYWAQLADSEGSLPHCGLVDSAGNPRPAFDRLQSLRKRGLG